MAQPERNTARPMSPHLQIYRWPVTMMTSIAHRATGIANYAGSALLAWWLVAIASGPEAYKVFATAIGSPIGLLVLFGYTWSLLYHLLNGVKHLVWDTGAGFDNKAAESSGMLVIVASIALAVGVWVLGFISRGGL